LAGTALTKPKRTDYDSSLDESLDFEKPFASPRSQIKGSGTPD
jgi:hypothetical protein